MDKKTGRFITFEGIEGCGKSTQQTLLVQWLTEQGQRVVVSKEPGGTDIGKRIREILLHVDHHQMDPACETLLYLADRAQHHREVVVPSLAAGAWLVCDRYHDSTLAYQGSGRGLPRHQLDALFQIATEGLLPDLTLLLDMDPEVGLTRARARNHAEQLAQSEGRFEAEALAFHTCVRASFLALAAAEPDRFVVINADQPRELVAAEIRKHVLQRLGGLS